MRNILDLSARVGHEIAEQEKCKRWNCSTWNLRCQI